MRCTNARMQQCRAGGRAVVVHSCILRSAFVWAAPARLGRRLPRQADHLRPPRARRPRHDRAGARPARRNPRRHVRCRCSKSARASRISSAWDGSTMCASMRAWKVAASRCATSSAPFTWCRKSSSPATSRRPASTSGNCGARVVDRFGTSPPLGRVDQLSLAIDRRAARARVSASGESARASMSIAGSERAALVFTIDPGPRTIARHDHHRRRRR